MFYNEREEKIVEILEKRNSATVGFLSKELNVSEPTIRRTLSKMQIEGKIKRTFGGAILSTEINEEVPLVLRERENVDKKRYIAKEAVKKIKEGDIIFIDASSTASYLIDELKIFLVVDNNVDNFIP